MTKEPHILIIADKQNAEIITDVIQHAQYSPIQLTKAHNLAEAAYWLDAGGFNTVIVMDNIDQLYTKPGTALISVSHNQETNLKANPPVVHSHDMVMQLPALLKDNDLPITVFDGMLEKSYASRTLKPGPRRLGMDS